MLANQYFSDGRRPISSLPSLRETPNGRACKSKTAFPIVVVMHVAEAGTGRRDFSRGILKLTARQSRTAVAESIQLLAASLRPRLHWFVSELDNDSFRGSQFNRLIKPLPRAMQIGRQQMTTQEIVVRNGPRVRPSEAASKLLSLRYLPWWRWHLHSCSTGVILGIRGKTPCP
jgi:hypothetical protein